MIKEKFMFRHYKMIMGILVLVGVGLFLLGNTVNSEFVKGYTQGIGFGLVGAGLINTIIIVIKKRNSEYVEEMEASFQDERVILVKLKALANAGILAIAELVVFSMLNVYFGFNLLYGLTIVFFTYALAIGLLKYYYNRK